MSTVIETAKGVTTGYNDKNWNTVKAAFAENGIYDEKATSRRVQGVGKILEVWQGWATAIPDSKATFVGEYASGDTATIEVVWRGTHTGPLQTATGTIPPSNKRIEFPRVRSSRSREGRSRASRSTSTWRPCSGRSARSRASHHRRGWRRRTDRKPLHASVRAVRVARPTRPPLSGMISSRRCVTAPADIDQSSRSKLVAGGLKLNSCRTSSR